MSTKNRIPVLVIFAPTASGKTALTRELFSPAGSHFILKAEVISADSQAVYKGMDIGTAKPEPSFCKEIPHHMIDLVSPDCQFSVSDFVERADILCRDIYQKGKLPLVCGGTGFYIRNFLFGLPSTPKSDEKIRNQLKERIEKEGNQALYEELCRIDPESAAKIHVNDAYRICRALEVFYTTGKKRSESQLSVKLRDLYDFCFIVLEPERELLFERIRKRVDLMFEDGLRGEVEKLIKAGYTKESPGMKAIGYSEFFDPALKGDDEKIREAIKHHSCKYAKKQYTYIRDIPESKVIRYNAMEMDLQKIADLIGKFAERTGFSIDLKA